MARLMAAANGDFTDASTWGLACSGANAIQTSVGAGFAVTTSYTGEGSNFTVPNAQVIDGAFLYLEPTGSTGTFTMGLSDDGGTTVIREVTVNVTDITAISGGWWIFFKFGSSVTGDGGSDYQIKIKTSNSGQVTIYYNGLDRWGKVVRSTVTQAPANGDTLHVAGEWTAAATKTDRAVGTSPSTLDAVTALLSNGGSIGGSSGGGAFAAAFIG